MQARWRTGFSSRSSGWIAAIFSASTSSKLIRASSAKLLAANFWPAELGEWFNLVLIAALVATFWSSGSAQANGPQNPESQQSKAEISGSEGSPTLFPHSSTSPFFVGGQLNMIFQAHPPFHAKY